MGASIPMAKGAADAGLIPAVAFIGDSTFTHSGMTGLLDCIWEKTPVTIIISDNDTTGMTGGQDSHALNKLYLVRKISTLRMFHTFYTSLNSPQYDLFCLSSFINIWLICL